MKEAWQHNAEFGGYAEPLPELPPPDSADDPMANIRKTQPSIMATFTVHWPDGEQCGPIIVSEKITKDCDTEKVFLRLAAKAATGLKSTRRAD